MTFANKTDKQVGKWHETENTNCHLPTLFSVWWANGVWAKVIHPNVKIINTESENPNLTTIRLTEVLKVGRVIPVKIWIMK